MKVNRTARTRVIGASVGWVLAFIVVFAMPTAADDNGAPRNGFGTGHPNELLITNLHNHGGNITIFEYRDGAYQEVWFVDDPEAQTATGGGEAGDLTGDGLPEFALQRQPTTGGGLDLEVWTFDSVTHGWYEMWSTNHPFYSFYVGDILDVDNDGMNELLVADQYSGRLDLYSFNGVGFEVEATVRDCAPLRAIFIATAGDLDGDGTPEILFQCESPEDLIVQEHTGGSYPVVGSVPPTFDSCRLILGLFSS